MTWLFPSLFGTPILCARTVMITIGFTASAFVYYQMVINVSNMVGNTFLNLFLLGLVEGPGNVLGKYTNPDNMKEIFIVLSY